MDYVAPKWKAKPFSEHSGLIWTLLAAEGRLSLSGAAVCLGAASAYSAVIRDAFTLPDQPGDASPPTTAAL